MRFTVQYPIASAAFSPAFLKPAALVRVAHTVEAAGLHALAFTEHPAPSHKWLESGGHDSLDPLSALAFCASVTSRVRLMPYLLVLPYRNPLLAAKQIATVDVLSGGRVTVAAGTGYLRSEFAALGVEYAERNELFEEAVAVMRGIWSNDEFQWTGKHFFAKGQTGRPRPVQQPGPPLWIGGNSRRARQRVARYGDGWTPLIITDTVAQTIGTPAMSSLASLRESIDDLQDLVAAEERDPASIDIQVEWAEASHIDQPDARSIELVHALAEAGVTWMVIDPPADDVERAVDAVLAYGEAVGGLVTS